MNNHSNEKNLVDTIDQLKLELKKARNNKASISVQFKHVIPNTDQHYSLLVQMQAISIQIKSIETALKEEEKLHKEKTFASINIKQGVHATHHPPLFMIDPTSMFDGEFTIRELKADQINFWYSFVNQLPLATGYHHSAWAETITQTFKHSTRIWAAFDSENRIIGGIPLTFFNSMLFGKFAVSIPYVNYGGVLATHFNIAKKLMEFLPSICDKEKLSHIEIRTMQADLAGNSSSKKASMILQLPQTSAALDTDLGSKVRAQYNKCEEFNPSIRFGKTELLKDFYSVFARNMRDLGTPVYTKNWFANILKNPRITSTIAIVYINSNPVSAGFLVGHNKMLEIPWASTVKEANQFNVNMWMYRKILDYAIEKEYLFFDFGRSTQDAGTYKFKKQWGSLAYTHYWYKILPGISAVNNVSEAPELNPDNPKFKLMISLWRKLPVWVANIIGPHIIRNIP
jgi:FemAB-related protein (PEP-CTERM system-associated)